MITGAFADLCVNDVVASAAFYRRLLGLDTLSDQGWYVELGVGGRVMLALVEGGHPTVPIEAGCPPGGLLVSFETDDADAVAATARAMGCRFLVEPTSELGQRHFMVVDPDSAVVDIIQRIAFTRADRERLVRLPARPARQDSPREDR